MQHKNVQNGLIRNTYSVCKQRCIYSMTEICSPCLVQSGLASYFERINKMLHVLTILQENTV